MYSVERVPRRIRLALVLFGAAASITLVVLTASLYKAAADINKPPAGEPQSAAAFNSTLGFARIYATLDPTDGPARRRLSALSGQLGLHMTYINTTTPGEAAQLKQQHGFAGSAQDVAELWTHLGIYRMMARERVSSALILSSAADLEADIKQRMSGVYAQAEFDILFLSRSHSEPGEPLARDTLAALASAAAEPRDASHVAAALGARREFLQRSTRAFRAAYPRGTTVGYAVNLRLAQRLSRRLQKRMREDAHDLDFVLADVAMVGLCLGLSLAPPPVSGWKDRQFLSASTLHAVGLRLDNPDKYPPYVDWQDVWR
ncbi:hypothetical protein IW150_002822 [Coemansia sp. RSA 2607]|nr:hypothetical protein IW150_002822 [Coemansia sp. RSA 2607]